MIIIGSIISFIIFFIILKLINVLFKIKNITVKEVLIGWSIIFIINCISVLFDIPMVIGIPYHPYLDMGATTDYYSLGYVICVNKSVVMGDETPTTVEFRPIL